jgi:hypothetical protein
MSEFGVTTLLITVALFIGMLVALEGGRRLGIRNLSSDQGGEGTGAVEAALFALLGLIIAFTFSGAAARFDSRRQLIIDEANNIGTAYLRIDLVAPEDQPALREKFREYVDSRLAVYQKIPDVAAVNAELERSQKLQGEIWTMAVAACKETNWAPAGTLFLGAINDMIDITTTRSMVAQMHPPAVVFAMLIVLILASAVLAGFGTAKTKTRSWLHIILFAITLSATVYVILDIEYPRLGLIRVDSFDKVLVDLRKSMN